MTGSYALFWNDPLCVYENAHVQRTEQGILFTGRRIKAVYCQHRKTPFNEFFGMLSPEYQTKIIEALDRHCDWHPLQRYMDIRTPPRWFIGLGSLMLAVFSFGQHYLDPDAFAKMVMTGGYYDTGVRKSEQFLIPEHRMEDIRFHDAIDSIITNPAG